MGGVERLPDLTGLPPRRHEAVELAGRLIRVRWGPHDITLARPASSRESQNGEPGVHDVNRGSVRHPAAANSTAACGKLLGRQRATAAPPGPPACRAGVTWPRQATVSSHDYCRARGVDRPSGRPRRAARQGRRPGKQAASGPSEWSPGSAGAVGRAEVRELSAGAWPGRDRHTVAQRGIGHDAELHVHHVVGEAAAVEPRVAECGPGT
jgi:hypothetical protein